MNRRSSRAAIAAVLAAVAAAACGGEKQQSGGAAPDSTHAGMAGMEGMQHGSAVTIPPGAIYTLADVQFMQGMIAHHAQAIFMSRLAASHRANPRLLRFAQKIDQSQRAEIVLMQGWLYDNNQFAPDTASYHTMSMPGMLTPAQIAQLEAARGAEFDRQFLVLMIQHHEGALKMVADLFASPRAAQDGNVSTFATDIDVGQTAEIALMHQMLADL